MLPMKIISLNANGIRSAARKGAFEWLLAQQADVVCLQETKAQVHQLDGPDTQMPGYHRHLFDAQKAGYSGVALYSRREPDAVIRGFGAAEFDAEGRYIEARFGDLSVVSVYLPSGSSGPDRQAAKFRCLELFYAHLQALAADGRKYILCGDWNIAHRPIDLKNWRSNQKNSGFTPEERAWLDRVFGELGWVDAYRVVEPTTEQYTWWSNRGQAWAKNVGWRIDYQIVSPNLAGAARAASVHMQERYSDHAPLTVDYAL